ncbi:hypothetical protein [Nitrospira sp. KM1]|uniref:hypothetical protein n=1 Tax=Nitrospira sp. KM1 TaxID=1936990 RepID=UPI001566354E|nr:hypothetical protein [Nitrospira sp. KM1]
MEALRIALGLCAGDHDTSVVLLGKSSVLVGEDIDDVVDVDILEKCRPSLARLGVPFFVESGSETLRLQNRFLVTGKDPLEIRTFLASVDQAIIFS